ncbi:MAG: diguanylate cyclase, partial [Acidimicrobiia bacterium]
MDEGRRWLRQLTEAVGGWTRGELDLPLPDRGGAAGLPSELIELHACLESARQMFEAQRTQQLSGALHDGLTGLPNRTHFTSLVRSSGARLARHGGASTVLVLDLDNFRHVNDELGHEAGDRLLLAVAERLVSAVRVEDAVARLGGDEFAVLLEGTGVEGATRPAERLLAAIASPFSILGQEVTVTASIGVSGVEPDVDAGELIRRGDVAMYVAKRSGKATATAFAPAMDDASRGRLGLEADLRQAPDRDELRLHYQPLFNLSNGQVIGIEALVRWEHPTRGLLAPAAFIGLAEETGLIVP